jgi:protein gp37
MSDTFHDGFSDSDRLQLFRAMVNYPETTYLILTKRAEKMKEFCAKYITPSAHNIWMGVTVEDQSTATRIPYLPDTGRCWISAEPLIGPVEIPEIDRLQWVVIGAETGPGHRHCWVSWVQHIIEQCDSAHIPVFVKKLGFPGGKPHGDMFRWPRWAQRREWPKI